MAGFEALTADPFAARRYLVQLRPYDPAAGAVIDLYFSDHGFTTEPGDNPPNRHWENRLLSAMNFECHLYRAGAVTGRSLPSFGDLELNNADGDLDGLRAYAFDGRSVRVWLGGEGFRFADHGLIFDGAAEQITFDDRVVRVRLRDLRERFAQPIQANIYSGDESTVGGAAIRGKPKPLCYGRVRHAEPVLVDPAALLYQVHDGAIAGIDAVRDRGVALRRVTGRPRAGQFAADAGAGTFTLGAPAAGIVTADLRGDATGGRYVESAAALIRCIAVNHAGFADPDDLDLASFAGLDAANAAPVGIHIREETPIQAVLDLLAASIGAHYGFNRAGKLNVGRLDAPAGPPSARFSAAELLEIEREPVSPPIWRQTIGYRRHWRVLAGADLATSLDAGDRRDWGERYRRESASAPAVRSRHLLAGEAMRDTLLADAADAAAEAQRLLLLHGGERELFRAVVKTQPFLLQLGETVRLAYPRYGLAGGKDFVVAGMLEESAVNQITLFLWG